MKSIKGPAIFLAQFASDAAPFNTFDSICGWAASLGYKGVQIPAWDSRFIDLKTAAASVGYCQELTGTAKKHGVEITELATHLQGQLVAVNPVYDQAFDAFAAKHVRGNPKARQEWATEQVKLAAKASRNMGLNTHVTFSGALAWPFLYPWPPLPTGLIETAFDELARRWKPILDAHEGEGVDVAFELHPGEDLFDGVTFERFLDKLKGHKRCCINYDPSHFRLQVLDYIGFIDVYHERIKAFHVKDAEFRPSPKQGVYSSYSEWPHRAGRFRSLGDGDIDFGAIFSSLSVYGYDSWAVLEWECAIKNRDDGAREGAEFIKKHLIEVSQSTFEDFIDQGADHSAVQRLMRGDPTMPGKKILMLTGEFTEEYEIFVYQQAMEAVGHTVHVVCPDKKAGDRIKTSLHDFEGDQTYTEKLGHFFTINKTFSEAEKQLNEYHAVYCAGGRGPEYIRTDKRVQAMVRHFHDAKKPIFTICHGVQILVAVDGVVRGKKVGALGACEPEVTLAGGTYIDLSPTEAYVDGTMVSAKGWTALAAFIRECLKVLGTEFTMEAWPRLGSLNPRN